MAEMARRGECEFGIVRTALCVSKSLQFAVIDARAQTLPWSAPQEPTQAIRFCIMAP